MIMHDLARCAPEKANVNRLDGLRYDQDNDFELQDPVIAPIG
jgi:hypothetical protein